MTKWATVLYVRADKLLYSPYNLSKTTPSDSCITLIVLGDSPEISLFINS